MSNIFKGNRWYHVLLIVYATWLTAGLMQYGFLEVFYGPPDAYKFFGVFLIWISMDLSYRLMESLFNRDEWHETEWEREPMSENSWIFRFQQHIESLKEKYPCLFT